MPQSFADVYANVQDPPFNAKGDGSTDDTFAIQAAIDSTNVPGSPRHILFPAGAYRFTRPIIFGNNDQKCTFLSGAVLKPASPEAFVQIGLVTVTGGVSVTTGIHQTITGMRIAIESTPHDPILKIDRASWLQMVNLQISLDRDVATSAAGWRMMSLEALTKCKFIGGRLTGNRSPGSTGFLLASPDTGDDGVEVHAGYDAGEVGAFGLTVEHFDTAVWLGCTTDNPTFVNCSFNDSLSTAVLIDGSRSYSSTGLWAYSSAEPGYTYNLNLIACHMSGADRYLHVSGDAKIGGGVISGCHFGSFNPGSTRYVRRSIFSIEGSFVGAVVCGCSHDGELDPGTNTSRVWEIAAAAQVALACDLFNAWDIPLTSPAAANRLAAMTSDGEGQLTTQGDSLTFDTPKMGFFGATAVSRESYTAAATGKRNLRLSPVDAVLATLLRDLGALGLIECP